MTDRPRVALTDPLDPASATELERVADVLLAAAPTADAIRSVARDADAIIVRAALPPDVFERAPHLIAVIRHGAGLDAVPLAEASRAGVLVANVPEANAVSVAEYAFAQMLALSRRLPTVDRMLRDQGWAAAREYGESGSELGGRVLGLVGTGAIGMALARIGSGGFGMTVLGARRGSGPPEPPIIGAPLDEVIELADYLVLACPLTEETRGLMSARRIASMKPGAVLVNIARGAVLDEAALVDALRSGHLGGAVLDVFAEQPLPAGSPLRDLDHVQLSPHLAGITTDSMRRIGRIAVEQVIDVLEGRSPPHLVDPAVWSRRRPGRLPPGLHLQKETT